MLNQQVPASVLEPVRLLDRPYFLTGGRKLFNDPNKLIIKRAAFERPPGIFSTSSTTFICSYFILP
jgi:hypothetical protein